MTEKISVEKLRKHTKSELKEKAKKLHEISHAIYPVYDCRNCNVDEIINQIPETAGIMIFFEKDEDAFGMERITYIGESRNLRERIKAHLKYHSKLTNLLNSYLRNDETCSKQANEYIKKNMDFVILEIEDELERKIIKNNMLYTLSEYNSSWLPDLSVSGDELILKYKLWASEYKKIGRIMTDSEIKEVESIIQTRNKNLGGI